MSAVASHDPIAELNITPLIDVLLVLIVMFILCLPIATHELPIDLPGKAGPVSDAPAHRLTLDRRGAAAWDGTPVDGTALRERLDEAAAREAQVRFAPDAATRFEAVDRTLAAIRRAGVTRLGFEGNDRYARF